VRRGKLKQPRRLLSEWLPMEIEVHAVTTISTLHPPFYPATVGASYVNLSVILNRIYIYIVEYSGLPAKKVDCETIS
jgi:hypothetical protein